MVPPKWMLFISRGVSFLADSSLGLDIFFMMRSSLLIPGLGKFAEYFEHIVERDHCDYIYTAKHQNIEMQGQDAGCDASEKIAEEKRPQGGLYAHA